MGLAALEAVMVEVVDPWTLSLTISNRYHQALKAAMASSESLVRPAYTLGGGEASVVGSNLGL